MFRRMNFRKTGNAIVQNSKNSIDKTWIKWYIYGQKHGGVPCRHWYGDTRKTYNEAVIVIVKAEQFSVGRRPIMRDRQYAEKEKARPYNRHGLLFSMDSEQNGTRCLSEASAG